MIAGKLSTAYQAGFDAAWITSDWLSIVSAGFASRSTTIRFSPGPRTVIGTVSATSTRRGSTGSIASSPSLAAPAEPVARYRSVSVPSATFTVKNTGFDSPAARSNGCDCDVATSSFRPTPVRASVSSNRTWPVSRPVDLLLTFTGISTTSPSRRNRGTSGSTIRSLAAMHVSDSTPLRRAAS